MNDDNTGDTTLPPGETALPPITIPFSDNDVDKLLNSSDVVGIKLSREGRAWRCKAHSLRASGGAQATSMIQAVHDAVVNHNTEWDKIVNG